MQILGWAIAPDVCPSYHKKSVVELGEGPLASFSTCVPIICLRLAYV